MGLDYDLLELRNEERQLTEWIWIIVDILDSSAHEKDSRRKKGKTRNWWEAREELGTCERSGDVYFDYCGICWMMEGKWGMDHPSGDPFGVFWENSSAIYDIYD
ncbi:hypothetical protein PV325_005228 [Microctonus aethiopoides]|uniref:Uncharacterized protein n=1 Tax=Microctonus aethiopoides TaxID=144406 RepID=A0AA39F0X3_9HYME|nr:hypothetical protein PV325_005228 [Microctonus aethiopoides]KAK0160486.1 hypothetical protein PV328_007893 [Microctonus aethiopoides]